MIKEGPIYWKTAPHEIARKDKQNAFIHEAQGIRKETFIVD
ncbi:MAG: hypothetical protein ACJ0HV_00995 [Candidatus Pseudothioglobus sp.]